LDKYYKYWEENLDEAPFDQTEFAYTGNHKPGNKDLKELSAEDYLDSFKEGTEHYYNNSQFYTEVSDGIPETIYDLITEWAESDEEKNVRPVVNSAALVLHDLGYISAKELTEIEAERINNAVGKVQGAYKLMKSVEADRKGKKQQVKKDPKDSMEKFSRIGAFSAGDSIAQLFHKLEFMVDNPTKCVPKEKEHIKDSLTFLINNCKSTDEQVLTNKYKLKKEQILEYLRKAS
jgi:copper chaperone CopZ